MVVTKFGNRSLGITGKDAASNQKAQFDCAYAFHSFRLDTIPQFSLDKKYLVVRNTEARSLYDDSYLSIIIFVASVVEIWLFYMFIVTGTTGYATLAAAALAVGVAWLSIKNARALKAIELSIEAINGIFQSESKVLKTTKSGPQSSVENFNFVYEQSIKKTTRSVIRKSKSLKNPFEKNLFLTSLALCHEEDLKSLLSPSYQHFDFIMSIDVTHLTTVLNKAETLCQGMKRNVLDERLVRDYFGADLTTVVNDLLPYIYTRREIHIIRAADKANSIDLYVGQSDGFGPFYKMKEETHDLLYEYLEYYCYKWYWSREDTPVCFAIFHQRIQAVYHACLGVLMEKDGEGNPVPQKILPYVQSVIECHESLPESPLVS